MDWRSVGKWVSRGLGYALAVPAGGTSIAIGEGVAQALGNSQATDQANQALQSGVAQGTATYDKAFAPYMNAGAQASNTLGGLMGFQMAPASSSAGENSLAALTGRAKTDNAVMTGQKAVPRETPLSPVIPDSPGRGRLGTLAELARPQMQTASSYGTVRMRAPDGEEADVDPREVSMFERAGARRIG